MYIHITCSRGMSFRSSAGVNTYIYTYIHTHICIYVCICIYVYTCNLQSGDEFSLKCWKTLCDVSRIQFKMVYDRLECAGLVEQVCLGLMD